MRLGEAGVVDESRIIGKTRNEQAQHVNSLTTQWIYSLDRRDFIFAFFKHAEHATACRDRILNPHTSEAWLAFRALPYPPAAHRYRECDEHLVARTPAFRRGRTGNNWYVYQSLTHISARDSSTPKGAAVERNPCFGAQHTVRTPSTCPHTVGSVSPGNLKSSGNPGRETGRRVLSPLLTGSVPLEEQSACLSKRNSERCNPSICCYASQRLRPKALRQRRSPAVNESEYLHPRAGSTDAASDEIRHNSPHKAIQRSQPTN